ASNGKDRSKLGNFARDRRVALADRLIDTPRRSLLGFRLLVRLLSHGARYLKSTRKGERRGSALENGLEDRRRSTSARYSLPCCATSRTEMPKRVASSSSATISPRATT